jgi:UDP-N-acetylmuramoyl-tripeptide--D-alanyl-D-alanine ligase
MSRITINIEDLFNLNTAVIYNPDIYKPVTSVSTDSRTLKKNSIFLALKGNNFDGHSFVEQAVVKGARAIIINKNRLKDFDNIDITIVAVKNSTIAYGELAGTWRKKLKAKVIGLTGSNGKTTTKEILAKIFEQKYSVCKTLANNNNHIGVPLTIFSANNNNDYVILEMGSNHFGEIAYSSKIAQPDFGVITNIGESHLAFLKNRQGVAAEKIALFKETLNANGKIFVNIDDKILVRKTNSIKNKITYGFTGFPDIKGKILGFREDGKPEIEVKYKSNKFVVQVGLPGLSNAKNFLAATAVALVNGISLKDIQDTAKQLVPVDKRMNIIEKESYLLINDTYNANPESMKAAFEFMKTFPASKRRITILGDMFELGDKSAEDHRKLSESLKKNGIDEVYTIGKYMKYLISGINGSQIISRHFKNRKSLQLFLIKKNFDNSIVLVKGSRGMKMEEFLKIFEGKN